MNRITTIFLLVLLIELFNFCNTTYQPVIKEPEKAFIADSLNFRKKSLLKYREQQISKSIKQLLSNTNYNFGSFYDEKTKAREFYKQNNYYPFWNSDTLILQGLQLINNSAYHGFNSDNYGKTVIDSLIKKKNIDSALNIELSAKLDLQLTLGILRFSGHLINGILDPKSIDSHWNYSKREIPNCDSLLFYFFSNGKTIEIEKLFEPKTCGYSKLKDELKKFQLLQKNNPENFSTDYPEILLRKGDSNEFVIPLKEKLIQLGLYFQDSITLKFDDSLELAVMKFQVMHGLTSDGIPGRKTYLFLNRTMQDYLDAIEVNLERIRWLPESFSDNYLLVNVPEYKIRLYHRQKLTFESKVIVGKYKNKTPLFSSEIEYLVFNPCWTIPGSIAKKDILPKLKTDTSYLEKRNMFVSLNGKEQITDSIDFSIYTQHNFPYKIFQRSGPNNALGQVKFMFPNKYQVYLHDSPYKKLFNKDFRSFSNGCVRVQNSLDLAKILLYDVDGNTTGTEYYLKKGYPEKVYLKKTVQLNIVYFTCFYDEKSNKVKFFKDVYLRDYRVLDALTNFN